MPQAVFAHDSGDLIRAGDGPAAVIGEIAAAGIIAKQRGIRISPILIVHKHLSYSLSYIICVVVNATDLLLRTVVGNP